jgi:hypothetical protein
VVVRLANVPGYVLVAAGLREDDRLGLRMLASLGRWLVPRYRFTWSELTWFDDPWLSRLLQRFGEAGAFNAHRRLMVRELLRLTAGVAGDTAECGVYQGCGSYIILHGTVATSRLHHAFDSFEGLSQPGDRDGTHWRQGDLSVSEQTVRANLAEFAHARFYKGLIPSRFHEVADRTFSFVHVDVDLHQPTLESVRFFYPRLAPGGILLCDDYGFTTCPGATSAVDEFLADKPEKMVALASGAGFLIKGTRTA